MLQFLRRDHPALHPERGRVSPALSRSIRGPLHGPHELHVLPLPLRLLLHPAPPVGLGGVVDKKPAEIFDASCCVGQFRSNEKKCVKNTKLHFRDEQHSVIH